MAFKHKFWTPQEDGFLRSQAKTSERNNWVQISRKLNQKFGGVQKSAKQCRTRFIGYATVSSETSSINEWSEHQIISLFKLYAKHGPRWRQISKVLSNKSENSLKNKFYCNLRKFVSKFNKHIKQENKNSKSQIKYDLVIRILDAIENFPQMPELLKNESIQIRAELLQYTRLTMLQQEIETRKLGQLAEHIRSFNYKTRSYRIKKVKSKQEQDFEIDPALLVEPFEKNIIDEDLKVLQKSIVPNQGSQDSFEKANNKQRRESQDMVPQLGERNHDQPIQLRLIEEASAAFWAGKRAKSSVSTDIFYQIFPDDFSNCDNIWQ